MAFIIIVLIIVHFYDANRTVKTSNMEVKYFDGKILDYKNFSKPFEDTRVIRVMNNSSTVRSITLKWVMVSNNLKKQNKFLYDISCEGDNCLSITPSQVPVADSTIFTDIYLESFRKQEYTIKLKYTGSEKNASFSGKLIIEEEITDQKKYDNYLRERSKRITAFDEHVESVQDMDKK